MKKKTYIAPDLEVALFETADIMDNKDNSTTDPFDDEPMRAFLPEGFDLNEDRFEVK